MFKCLNIRNKGMLYREDILGSRKQTMRVNEPVYQIFDSADSNYTYCTRKQLELLRNIGISIDNLDYDNFNIKTDYIDLNSNYFEEIKNKIFLVAKNYSKPIEFVDIAFKIVDDLEVEKTYSEMIGFKASKYSVGKINFLIEFNGETLYIVVTKPLILSGVDKFVSDGRTRIITDANLFDNCYDFFIGLDKYRTVSDRLYINYSLDLSNVDMSLLEDISSMFQSTKLASVKFNKTLRPRIMNKCFFNSKITNVDFSSFDTSNLESIDEMFRYCSFKEIDLSDLNTSRVTSIMGLFANNKNIKSINLSRLDFSSVKNASDLFSYCIELQYFNTNMLNFNNLVQANYMFYHCDNLKSISLNGLNKATQFDGLLRNCISLESVDLTVLDLEKENITCNYIFSGCTKLNKINGFDTIINKTYDFSDCFNSFSKFEFTNTVRFNGRCENAFHDTTSRKLHVVLDEPIYDYAGSNTARGLFSRAKIDELVLDVNSAKYDLSHMFWGSNISSLTINLNIDFICMTNIFLDSHIGTLTINVINRPKDIKSLFKYTEVAKFIYNERNIDETVNFENAFYRCKIYNLHSNNKIIEQYFNKKVAFKGYA